MDKYVRYRNKIQKKKKRAGKIYLYKIYIKWEEGSIYLLYILARDCLH